MRVNSIGARHYLARRRPAYVAFLVHRLSGLALALFLPAHFWALGQALRADAELEGFLRWTDSPLVKAAEWGLVVLLAAHAGGGLRLLALEFLPWRGWQQSLLAIAAAFSVAVGLAFALAL
jgi:fumarate reductase subunit D